MKRLLFIRHYQAFTGGHLKVFHYVQHTLSSGFARPVVLLTADSSRNETNPFVALPDLIVTEPVQHDLLVLGGTDWEFAEKLGILSDRIPILNIIQNVRHARPDDPRRKWLRRAATRICVSQEVADAIISTGEVNGSVHLIPCGIPSLDHLRIAQADRSIDVFVAGLKDPLLAVAVASRLSDTGVASDVLLSSVDRNEYLRRMARARVAVLLTSELEGFFLPALEAMALEVAVVCPDTPGVRGLCRAEDNALVTARDPDAMVAATRRLLENQALCARIGARGRELAKVHTLQRERDDFLRVLSGAAGPRGTSRLGPSLRPCALLPERRGPLISGSMLYFVEAVEMPVSPLKRLLVLRRLQRFNGGVLKTLDYFCHARASGLVQARMLLLPPRPWDNALESYLSPHEVVTEPDDPDIVLLSREWDEADRLGLSSPERTFIHLVQHTDHVTEGSAEYGSLSRPAFRIVVSREYAERISAYAHLNGGLTTIEAGVCVRREAIPWNSRRWDVTIAGQKNPQVAQAVAALLAAAGHSVRLLIDRLSRRDYLDYVAQARILIALPQQIGEVAFLTALEGMHLDVVVVLPEIFGLGRYCINELTCLTTAYEAHDIANRTIELMRHTEKMNKLRRGGAGIASRLTIANERRRFTDVLTKLVAEVPSAFLTARST